MTEREVEEVDLSAGTTTINENRPLLLHAVYINAALSAHDVPLKDGSTQKFVVPSSAVKANTYTYGDSYFERLVVEPDVSATGKIAVVYEKALKARRVG